MLTRRRPIELGVEGRLEFGVFCLEFGVVGLLENDPDRKSGNRWGETVRFSISLGI